MEWSKIKNIVILILLCVNGALLGLLIPRERQQALFAAETWSGAVSALERGGITFAADSPPLDMALTPLSVTRDRTGEQAAAEALLGPLQEDPDSSPVRTLYTGPGGTAEFTMAGECAIRPAEGVRTLEGSRRDEAGRDCLLQLGFTGRLLEERTEPLPDGGERHTLTYCQEWEGVPIFSCQIQVVWQGEQLLSIQGERLTGTAVPGGGEVLSTAGALVRFLAGLNQAGALCTRIDAMTAGYLITEPRPVQLTPVWSIETDNGVYYLNALDGALLTLE
ncbi:MAG: hypothetical protein HFF30_10330 [Flavonifractor sp.]|nr:hypothetical protein [Flavonifractor sp.]